MLERFGIANKDILLGFVYIQFCLLFIWYENINHTSKDVYIFQVLLFFCLYLFQNIGKILKYMY